MAEPDDTDRLIQDVLAELGWESDARRIADKVRQLDRGLPAEDEFMAVCAWLGQTRLIHKLDQHQSPPASRGTYQVPDLLADFQSSGPVLIEVKAKRSQTLSFTPEYFGRLTAYADLLGKPLLIAWKFYSIWMLFEVRHLRKTRKNFNIRFDEAMRQNLLGVLAGDVSYKIAPGAGIVLECLKEELLETETSGDTTTEQWRTPASSKSLRALGELVGQEKIQLDPDPKKDQWYKENMDALLRENPELFDRYALNDAVICVRYADRMIEWSEPEVSTSTAQARRWLTSKTSWR